MKCGGTQQGAHVLLTIDYCLIGIRVEWNTHGVCPLNVKKTNRKELP